MYSLAALQYFLYVLHAYYNKFYYYISVNKKSFFDFVDIVKTAGPQLSCFEYKFDTKIRKSLYHSKLDILAQDQIIIDYINGSKIFDLANEFNVSVSSIERIIYSGDAKQKRKQLKQGNVVCQQLLNFL